MSDEKKKPSPSSSLAGGIFANALASANKAPNASVAAGMHNTLACPKCGATREKQSEDLTCRYCGTALAAPAGK